MSKRVIALLLCAAATLALVACAPDGDVPNTDALTEATEATDATDAPTEPTELVVENGILCLTFDDLNFVDWLKMLPVFEKYDAHATFFIMGEIDAVSVNAMKKLQAAGHSIGLHTVNHKNNLPRTDPSEMDAYFAQELAPQLEACQENGIEICGLAYPFNVRNEMADEYLSQYFPRFRAGDDNATEEQRFIPLEALKDNVVMRGAGLCSYYNITGEGVLKIIEKIAETNTCFTFFSHAINRSPTEWDMTPELLESILKKAQELGVKVMGFSELDAWLEN